MVPCGTTDKEYERKKMITLQKDYTIVALLQTTEPDTLFEPRCGSNKLT